jgi:hypothetical protein
MKITFFAALIACLPMTGFSAAFQGRITTAVTRNGETHHLLYTVGTNFLRIDCLETDHPYPSDIVDTGSQEITVVFHHNGSFVRFPLSMQNPPAPTGFPQMAPAFPQAPPTAPAAIGPKNLPGIQPPQMPAMPQMPNPPAAAGIGPQSSPGMPGMAMPMMPPMQAQAIALKDTGETTNILGYQCARYTFKWRDETMDIWATDQLLPFQAYLQNQPLRFGPRMMENQWEGLLTERKVFPLLAILKTQSGMERLRFEVTGIQPEKIADKDGTLSHPPACYNEIQPLPF